MKMTRIPRLILPLLFSAQAFAGWSGVSISGGGDDFSCAPEVVNGNVAATESVLEGVLSSSDFQNETRFRTEVSRIEKLSPEKKASAYIALVVQDPKEITKFMGERDLEAYLPYIETTTGLDRSKAATVAHAVSSALLGAEN